MEADHSARETYILNRLAEDGSLSVSSLSRDLGVSEVTIRTNLRSLEEQGLLARTRGGAAPTLAHSVLQRRKENLEAKNRIAAAAAELVEDNDRIMIEAGTTTALIVKHLVGRKGIQIVTNSTLVFSYARLNPALTVILTGGAFNRQNESLVGPVALKAIGTFNARLAFVGTDGFSVDRGMTTHLSEGAEVLAAMARRAEETWLVADSTKYGRAGFVSVLELADLAGIITDEAIGPDSLAALQDSVRQVRIAGKD